MKPDLFMSAGPKNFNLNPLGIGIVTEVLHQGAMFDVYRATIGEDEVVLKTPAANPVGYSAFVKSVNSGSETFVRTEQYFRSLSETAYNSDSAITLWLMLDEAATINRTNGAWNHRIIVSGTWDGFSNNWKADWNPGREDESLNVRFTPVLVMPFYDATPLSALPNSLKRISFPKMLPALWDALCKNVHGDLSESNLLINQTQNIFHIIDPGAYISSGTDSYEGLSFISIFTTNRDNYPIFEPSSGDRHKSPGLLNFIESRRSSKVSERSTSSFDIPDRPAACDLLAMGIIYYRMLTGKEIFLNEDLLSEPLWFTNYQIPWSNQEVNFEKLSKALSEGYIERELETINVSPAERRLAQALLNLEVLTRKQLSKLNSF